MPPPGQERTNEPLLSLRVHFLSIVDITSEVRLTQASLGTLVDYGSPFITYICSYVSPKHLSITWFVCYSMRTFKKSQYPTLMIRSVFLCSVVALNLYEASLPRGLYVF